MTDPKLPGTHAPRQPRRENSPRSAPGALWSVDAIRAAQRVGPAKRARPGVVPLDTEAKAKRRGLPPGALALLDWLTDHAHYGPLSGADCSGLVSVRSVPWLAEQTGRGERTVRRQLATIERAGFVQWLARPSRSRSGVLAITDYPARKRSRPAARVDATPRAATTSRAGRASATIATGYPEVGHGWQGSDPVAYKDRARRSSEREETERNHGGESQRSGPNPGDRKRPGFAALVDLHPSELRDVDALDRRFRALVKAGHLHGTDRERFDFVAEAVHARRAAKRNPAGLFAANVRAAIRGDDPDRGLCATDRDEDEARRMIASHERRHALRPPRRPAARVQTDDETPAPIRHATGTPATLSASDTAAAVARHLHAVRAQQQRDTSPRHPAPGVDVVQVEHDRPTPADPVKTRAVVDGPEPAETPPGPVDVTADPAWSRADALDRRYGGAVMRSRLCEQRGVDPRGLVHPYPAPRDSEVSA